MKANAFSRASFVVAALIIAGCTGASPKTAALTQATTMFPSYNKVYGIATHDSNFLNRSDYYDYFDSGTQELISDQLLHEHVLSLEIDIHSEGAPTQEWKAYGTSDSENFKCRYLSDCLEYLRNFHYALPQHEAVNVIVEFKNVVPNTGAFFYGIPVNYQWDLTHQYTDFDNLFRNALGDALYTPKDFKADNNCDSSVTMLRCAKEHGWPTIDKLRGKFIISLQGNWSTNAYDWVLYANQDVTQHVAFPMQSVFDIFPTQVGCTTGVPQSNAYTVADITFDGGHYCLRDIDDSVDPSPWIDPAWRQTAFDASIIWQWEEPGSGLGEPIIAQFIKENGIVRAHDSWEYEPDCINDVDASNCQEQRIRAGYQFVQTDFPWHVVNDTAPSTLGIPTDPSQRIRDPKSLPDENGNVGSFSVFNEPGSRIYFQTSATYPGTWAFATIPETSERWWEATVSSTRHGDVYGNLTYSGLLHKDYLVTCPGHPTNVEGPNGTEICTNYARVAQEDGEGCIKVSDDGEKNGVEICRQKNTQPGASYYQESVDLYVRTFVKGALIRSQEYRAPRYAPCKSNQDPNSDDVFDHGCIGSMIAVSVKNSGQSSQVTVYSAGKLLPGTSPPLLPDWTYIGTGSFTVPMTKQGYRGWKSELFAGVRTAEALMPSGANPGEFRPVFSGLHEISLSDLPNQEAADASSTVVDLSFAATLNSKTTPTISPTPNAYGWIGKPALSSIGANAVTVTLTAPDPLVLGGAAFASIDYSLSGAQMLGSTVSTTNPTALSIAVDGQTTVSYYAVDVDRNQQALQSTVVSLDTVSPQIVAGLAPQPNNYGWNRSPVTVSFTCTDATSGVLACSNSVVLTAEGANQSVVGNATDRALNAASTTASVNIDMTPPTISYSGNAGTYSVDQTVSISCSATDSLSGIASTTCTSINGPAYSFNIGPNTFTSDATDRASNVASASTSFTVQVTAQGLCNLTTSFSSSGGVAGALCARIFSIASAPNANAKQGKLNAFDNQVRAQTGKAFDTNQAGILLRLAAYL